MIYLNGQRRSALLAYLIEKLMALAGVDLLTLRLIPPTLTLTLTEMTAGFTFSTINLRRYSIGEVHGLRSLHPVSAARSADSAFLRSLSEAYQKKR